MKKLLSIALCLIAVGGFAQKGKTKMAADFYGVDYSCVSVIGANEQPAEFIKAFEAMCATDSLPCNVKFMLEGEEEIGSPSLYGFCEQNKELLKADIILVSDTSMISMQTPSITCGLRGLDYMEVEVTGPDKDLHSD